jgi:hypothetical protein
MNLRGKGQDGAGMRVAAARLTFDCRVVLVNKVTLDELDGQTRLSDTTTADDYELVLAEKLRQRVSTRRRVNEQFDRQRTFEAMAATRGESVGGEAVAIG